MNGVHDLGGMHGFGPVVLEPDEPVFHAEWERRTFALNLAMGAWRRWNLDMSRFAREQMPPAEYLATSYYEHWLWGLERLLERHGFLAGPTSTGACARAPIPGHRVPPSRYRAPSGETTSLGSCRNRRAARLDDPVPPQFKAGDAVRRPKRQPRRSHPDSPLRPGPQRRDRPRPWRLHLPRHARGGPRPEAPARLQRALRRA